MYRTKRLHLWPSYFAAMQRTDTIRGSAQLLGVQPSTTFRWRHRILAAVRAADDVALEGVVEVKAFRLPFSEKGSRTLQRRAYARGLRGVWRYRWPERYETIIQAYDRGGRTCSLLTGTSRPPAAGTFCPLLDPHLQRIRRLIGDADRQSALSRYAAAREVELLRMRPEWRDAMGDRTPVHLDNVSGWIHRLREWLIGFQGVATKYLPHYLAWRRVLEGQDEDLLSTRWVASCVQAPTLSANTAYQRPP